MSTQTKYDRVSVLGVEVDAVDIAQATELLLDRAADTTAPAVYVVKPYVEFMDRAASDATVRQLLNGAFVSVADGVAIVWAAAFLYAGPRSFRRYIMTLVQIVIAPKELLWPLPERFAGTNFVLPMLRAAGERGIPVMLIGTPTHGNIELTVHAMTQQVPTLRIVAAIEGLDPLSARGQVSAEWLQRAAATVTSAQPGLILVGMGFPLQERVMAQLVTMVPTGVFIGEGGTFDYTIFGGTLAKAPLAVQKLGLEWAWRLILNPSRWRRQLAIPRFLIKVWRSR